jgi:hypothetical protein
MVAGNLHIPPRRLPWEPWIDPDQHPEWIRTPLRHLNQHFPPPKSRHLDNPGQGNRHKRLVSSPVGGRGEKGSLLAATAVYHREAGTAAGFADSNVSWRAGKLAPSALLGVATCVRACVTARWEGRGAVRRRRRTPRTF